LLQTEQTAIAFAVGKEYGVVLITLVGTVVSPKALAKLIVVMIRLSSCPSMTLDAKMVVGLSRQFAASSPRFQHTLRQRDAGGNMVFKHLLDGYILVGVKIILKALVPHSLLCRSIRKGEKQAKKKKYIPSHVFLSSIILQK
jgi:hypothetical protein